MANNRRTWYTPAAMPPRHCAVYFVDPDGVRHCAEVEATSVFEAAILAICAFRAHGCAPGQASTLVVEVRGPTVHHAVTVNKVENWLQRSARSPAETLAKERLAKAYNG